MLSGQLQAEPAELGGEGVVDEQDVHHQPPRGGGQRIELLGEAGEAGILAQSLLHQGRRGITERPVGGRIVQHGKGPDRTRASGSSASTRRPVSPVMMTWRCGSVSEASTTQPAAMASSSDRATGYARPGAMCRSLAARTSATIDGGDAPRNQRRFVSERRPLRQEVCGVILVVERDVEPPADDPVADHDDQRIGSGAEDRIGGGQEPV